MRGTCRSRMLSILNLRPESTENTIRCRKDTHPFNFTTLVADIACKYQAVESLLQFCCTVEGEFSRFSTSCPGPCGSRTCPFAGYTSQLGCLGLFTRCPKCPFPILEPRA
jgi:hypothetical protein